MRACGDVCCYDSYMACGLQARESKDAVEAQIVSRSTAASSQSLGLLVIARARQLAFVDLATAAAASAPKPSGDYLLCCLQNVHSMCSCVAAAHVECGLRSLQVHWHVLLIVWQLAASLLKTA